jgi:hypothetical protein
VRYDSGSTLPAGVPVRLTGGWLIGVAILFALLWLSEDVPAVLRGVAPASLAEAGLPTNPVHVLDLAIVLPAMLWSGVVLLRRRVLGAGVAAALLAFTILMLVAIGGMALVMRLRGISSDVAPVVITMGGGALASAVVLTRFLLRSRGAW